MSKRNIHDVAGAGAGALAACWNARELPPENAAWEILGGTLAGIVGSRLPDRIDPPSSPNHRSLGHGALTACAGGKFCITEIAEWQSIWRSAADRLAEERKQIDTDGGRALNQLLECIYRMAAGAIPGLLAGYVSHLALDLTTTKGLPLLMRGF